MATVASQIVFHPVVSRSLQIGQTSLGRDKLYRAIQYFARFYAWYRLRHGDKEAAAKWNALKSHLATARKLLRLGKPVEHVQAALRTSFTSGPPSEQITAIARQIAYALYLTLDAFVWANSVKFLTLQPATAQKVSRVSNRFWLAGILLSIANSIIKGSRLKEEAKRLKYSSRSSEKDVALEADLAAKRSALKSSAANVKYQLTLDLLDVWLPATALGHVPLSDGAAGILGLITSVMALRKQWATASK